MKRLHFFLLDVTMARIAQLEIDMKLDQSEIVDKAVRILYDYIQAKKSKEQ